MKKEDAKVRAFGPLFAGALCALLLVVLFLHAGGRVQSRPYPDFAEADGEFFASLDHMSADPEAGILYLDGWAKDTRLYYGYNFGTDYSFFATLENTAFALTDGETVVVLRCERIPREDVDALFKAEKRPEGGVPERCGLHAAVRKKDFAPFGENEVTVALVSLRRDGRPVIFLTGEKAVLP